MIPRKSQYLNLNSIKENTRTQHIKPKLIEIYKNTHHKRALNTHLFPQSDVGSPFIFNHQSKDTVFELEWLSELIGFYKTPILAFLDLKEAYTLSYFKSDIEECKRLLNLIENQFGINIWLIESKINLFNTIDNTYKLSQDYVDDLMNSRISIHYKIISWVLLMKSEEMVSSARFEIELDRITNTWSLIKKYNLRDFLIFKFSMTTDIEEIDSLAVLRTQENLSLLDRYFTLVEILSNIYEKNHLNINKSLVAKITTKINTISKSQLSPYYSINSSSLIKDTKVEAHLNEISNAFDQYTKGDYDKTISLCEDILAINPHEIEVYEIYAKSLLIKDTEEIKENSNQLNIQIINLILSYYKNPKDIDNDLITKDLLKICSDHISNDWAWKLLSFSYVIKYGNKILESIPSFKKGYKLSNFVKPQIIPHLYSNNDNRMLYIDYAFDKDSLTKKVHEAYVSLDIKLLDILDIEDNRKLRLQGNLNLLKENFIEALSCFNQIDYKNSKIHEFEINIGKIQAHLSIDDIEMAINIIVDSYFSNKNLLLEIDTEKITSRLKTEQLNSKNINILIFIELLSKYVNPVLFKNKQDYLEDFLLVNNIKLISEIDINTLDYDIDKMVYILYDFCTIDNIAKYYYFESQEQVEEERIKICRILTELDPHRKEIYNEEIKEITQKMQIREHSAALEKSKIYVDIDGIKKQATRKIEENFNRIIEYFNSMRNKGEPVVFTINGNFEGEIKKIKGNRYSDIYNDLIYEIRDSFISSKEYGLDVYLSLGIRHGTIFGQLRKLFENDHFLTLFVSNSNKYKRNDYWLEKMNVSNTLVKRKVDEAFQQFNSRIDNLLLTLKDQTLQITTDSENTAALFNYDISTFDLGMMYTADYHDKSLSIDSFMDKAVDKLWSITEQNLLLVRSYLTKDFKDLILEEVNDFIDTIHKINSTISSDSLNLQEFDQKFINLKTDLEYQIKKVSNWFTKEKVVEIDNFSIDLPINIALEFAKSINNNSTIDSHIDVTKELQIDGKYLKWFNELFITIFDNIFKRSGLRNHFNINLNVYLNEKDQLVIDCRNPLALTDEEIALRKIALKEKLNEIDIVVNNEESDIMSRASIEGGSGLYKIVKLLKYDIKSDDIFLDFDIDENEFYILIKLNTGGFAVVNTNS